MTSEPTVEIIVRGGANTGKSTLALAIQRALTALDLHAAIVVFDDRDIDNTSLDQRLAQLAQSYSHRDRYPTIRISTENRSRTVP